MMKLSVCFTYKSLCFQTASKQRSKNIFPGFAKNQTLSVSVTGLRGQGQGLNSNQHKSSTALCKLTHQGLSLQTTVHTASTFASDNANRLPSLQVPHMSQVYLQLLGLFFCVYLWERQMSREGAATQRISDHDYSLFPVKGHSDITEAGGGKLRILYKMYSCSKCKYLFLKEKSII